MIRTILVLVTLSAFAALLMVPASAAPGVRTTRATLSGPTLMHGEADFQVRTRANGEVTRRLDIRVKKGAPLKAMPVRLNGKPVGAVVTNFLGNGRLVMRCDGVGAAKLPKAARKIKSGDAIKVGSCAGTWWHDHGDDNSSDDNSSDDDSSDDDSSDDFSSDDDSSDDDSSND